jgi:hypothetical protein
MTGERLTAPKESVWKYAHGLALKLARERLAGITDAVEQCRRAGAQYDRSRNAAVIDYLGRSCRLSIPDGQVVFADTGEEAPLRERILVLHYFINARGTPLSGKTITYKELHDGINYYPTFFKRAIQPIVENFGRAPERLLELAEKLGGHRADLGDVAVTIDALPRVPLTTVLWRGDDEFPPDGNILFDSTIPDYLPIEDITVISEILAWKLVKALKTGGDSPGNR